LKKHNKKKIYLFLSGGLGNQLFQYAFARNLSIKNKADLIVDAYSGFIFDFRYFRIFSLKTKLKKKIVFFFSFFPFKLSEKNVNQLKKAIYYLNLSQFQKIL